MGLPVRAGPSANIGESERSSHAEIIVGRRRSRPGIIWTCYGSRTHSHSSDWGSVTAELVENDATRSLVRMLPLTLDMRDHLRQEKTGNLPSPLPAVERQLDFSTGTLGLWSSNHFVIYYRDGRVPQPGIIVLGRVTGDVSIFDRPGPVTVRVERVR